LWPHSLCTSANSGNEWSTSLAGRFTPGKEALDTTELEAG